MLTIRKATTDDAAILAEVGKISFLESHGHSAASTDTDEYISKKFTVHAMEEELQNVSNSYHLIYYQDKVAGYSKIILNSTNENVTRQNVTCLDRLYLLKEFYGLALGLKLLEFNIHLSKQARQAGMWLNTWIDNDRAVAFYQKAGFRIVGKKDFKISETHTNPNHVMYLAY